MLLVSVAVRTVLAPLDPLGMLALILVGEEVAASALGAL
jgi:hypothetical protein